MQHNETYEDSAPYQEFVREAQTLSQGFDASAIERIKSRNDRMLGVSDMDSSEMRGLQSA